MPIFIPDVVLSHDPNSSPACPSCGAALPADAPEGALCAACEQSLTATYAEPAPDQVSGPEIVPQTPTPSFSLPPTREQKMLQSIGDYEVTGKLGQGGMGAVYRARQVSLGREVALKVLPAHFEDDQDYVGRFQREAKVAASLNHPNLVRVYASGVADGAHYIAMELVEGENLRLRLKPGTLEPAEALRICADVARGLQCGWERAQLIHRDIKPSNIYLSHSGEVKLGDLGLAKSLSENTTGLTQTGTAMGTPHYMSPEQVRGEKTLDFRADIYSLGCTLYEMLTGHPPYEGRETLALMNLHVTGPVPAILKERPDLPIPLGRLVTRMLKKSRHERPQSYEDLISEMDRIREQIESGGAAGPSALVQAWKGVGGPSAAQTPRPPSGSSIPAAAAVQGAKKGNPLPWIGIAAGVLALAVAGFIFTRPGKPKRAPARVAKQAEPLREARVATAGPASTSEAAAPPQTVALSQAVELLPLVQISRDVVKGTWSRSGNDLLLETTDDWGICELPYDVPEEYDIEAEFTPRSQGNNVNLHLRAGRNSVVFKINARGQNPPMHGFDNIDGRIMLGRSEGVVTDPLKLEPDRRYTTRVEVRRSSLRAFVDGRRLVSWEGDFQRLSTEEPGRLRNGLRLAIGSYSRSVTFHRATLRPFAAPAPASTTATTRYPTVGPDGLLVYAPGIWTRPWPLEAESEEIAERDGGWVRLNKTALGTRRHFTNSGMRARFRGQRKTGGTFPQINLRGGRPGSANLNIAGDKLQIRRAKSGEGIATLAEITLQNKVRSPDREYTMEFYVVGRTLIGRVDRETVTAQLDEPEWSGGNSLFNADQDFIRDFEIINLDGIPEAEALKIAKGEYAELPAGSVGQYTAGSGNKPNDNATEPWQDLLRERAQAVLSPGAEWTPEGLRLAPGAYASSRRELRNGAIRIRTKAPSIGLQLRRTDHGEYTVWLDKQTLKISSRDKEADHTKDLASSVLATPLAPGQEYELEARIVDSTITVAWNGQTVASASDGKYPAGEFRVRAWASIATAPAMITRWEMLALDATGGDPSKNNSTSATATKDAPFVNSLGMEFVPVPGTDVLFCRWETRVKDYRAFAEETNRRVEKPDFAQAEDHPAVRISWDDATAFCAWLSKKEGREYRLPTDAEWSVAVGLPQEIGSTPKDKNKGVADVFPWGTTWPPPAGAGNFADAAARKKDSTRTIIDGYDDGFADTAPVASFRANRFGLHDLGGNVWEWCQDWYDGEQKYRVLRGGSFNFSERDLLLSSSRRDGTPAHRYSISGFRCVVVGGASGR